MTHLQEGKPIGRAGWAVTAVQDGERHVIFTATELTDVLLSKWKDGARLWRTDGDDNLLDITNEEWRKAMMKARGHVPA